MNIYIIILFLVNSLFIIKENASKNIVFNDDVIIENNLIVENMDSNGVININGNSFNATGNINVYENANVTLTASPGIYFNNLKSENLVYYLVLDENNALKYTTLSPEENPILNLNTNLIQSEPNCNLTVGSEIDQININGETIQFSNKLNCNTISFNQPVEINTEMHFLNTVNVNKDINVKGGDVILENKNTNLITINCNQFTTPIPINTFGGLIIGKSNFSSTITINNIIGNTTLGSKKYPINTINELLKINTPSYYLVKDNNGIVKKYDVKNSYLINQNSYTNNIIFLDNMESKNEINFNTNTLSIITDNLNLQYNSQCIIDNLNIENQECIAESYFNHNGLFINIIFINPNLSLTIDALYSEAFNNIKFYFSHYFLKNLPSIFMIKSDFLTIELSTGRLTIKDPIFLNQIKNENISTKLNPIIFTYKDNYKMKNNDICYKNNSKIEHFGFTAEELEVFNIENLIIKDSNNKIIDYNTELLTEIILEKINLYEKHYQNIIKKYHSLEKKIEEIKNKNNINKNIISQKKKLIKLLQAINK